MIIFIINYSFNNSFKSSINSLLYKMLEMEIMKNECHNFPQSKMRKEDKTSKILIYQ